MDRSREDLSGAEAIWKIKELVSRVDSCFFCTESRARESIGARPMAVQEVDDAGHLWFLSADDSHKNEELMRDAAVRLYFQGSPHSDFLVLDGAATVTRDRARIRHLWSPLYKTWFTEGPDDPRITVIEVTPSEGYYWDNKHGDVVAGVKMWLGAALGKTLDDSIEGRIGLS